MKTTSSRRAFVLGSLGIVSLALLMAWYSGPFPVPWNDELVFTDIGNRFMHSGRLSESFWAMYDPRFGEGLVNTPPLYPIFIGLLRVATGGSLMAMRMVHGGILVSGLALWVGSQRCSSLQEPGTSRFSPALLFLLALVANPYFLRSAFFIRPDGFILLAFLWISGHIWSGTFLSTRRNALKAGAIMGIAGQTHFSALVLLPLFAFGAFLALRRRGHTIMKPLGQASALGAILMGPYLAWFLPRIGTWWKLVQATQGSQKYFHAQSLGSYLWPPDFLIGRLAAQQWAPSAWGPTTTFYIWILILAGLPMAAIDLGRHERSAWRGASLWILGMVGTWFFVRLPEMWFSTLGVLTVQVVLTLYLWDRYGPKAASLASASLVLIHLISQGFLLEGSGLPSWTEHQASIARIESILEKAIPGGPSQIYVSALPDPSVDLIARWPDIKITRGMDFSSYQTIYSKKVLTEPQAWILGEPVVQARESTDPRAFLFDWGHPLANAVGRGELELHPVRWGGHHIWVALRHPGAPMGQSK